MPRNLKVAHFTDPNGLKLGWKDRSFFGQGRGAPWWKKTQSQVQSSAHGSNHSHDHVHTGSRSSGLIWSGNWPAVSGNILIDFLYDRTHCHRVKKTKYSSQDHGSMSKGCFLFWVSLHFFGNIPCLPPFSEFVSGPKSFEKPRHRAGIEGGTATGDNLWRSDVVGWVDCKWKFLGTEAKPVYYELFNYYDIYIHIYM